MIAKRTDWIWGTPLGLEYQDLIGEDNASLIEQHYVWRINLRQDEEELFRGMTKGHRYNIRQAGKNKVEVIIFNAENITQDIWNEFLIAHKTTESRKKRHPRCWEIMLEFIQKGEGFLAGALYENRWIAFSHFLIYEDRAYYAMGNIEEKYRGIWPAHLIQWEAMLYMKQNGISVYDIGTDYVGSIHTQKEKSITRFKKGFGGFTAPLYFAENDTTEPSVSYIFLLKKSTGAYQENAKKIILNASEPLAFQALYPIIESLRGDFRCREIVLLTDNVAAVYFKKYFEEDSHNNKFTLANNVAKDFDIALVTIDSYTNPDSLIFQAKEVSNVKKLFVIHYSWTALTARKDILNKEAIQNIDGVFCNDELAKQIVLESLPNVPKHKIFVTGTPIVDILDIEQQDTYWTGERRKLGIGKSECAILYLGDTDADYKTDVAIDTHINKKTFEKTVEAIKEVSLDMPQEKFVLMVRPHPRDLHREELVLSSTIKLPSNFRVLSAHEDAVSVQEAVYVSDVVVSIVSSENHIAALRGRPSIFLGYDVPVGEKFLGKKVLMNVYGEKIINLFKKEKGMRIVSTEEELVRALKDIVLGAWSVSPPSVKMSDTESASRILEKMFE